ncbi:MAG: zinc ribbon domain-containing protein [Methylotenera sp.]|nr:zinc ribbon domain-containing protein [Methylotenera sp.]
MFCSECGKQVADDAKFCGECGAVQNSFAKTPPSTTVNSTQYPAVKTMSGIVKFGGGFLVLMFTLAIIAPLLGGKKAKGVSQPTSDLTVTSDGHLEVTLSKIKEMSIGDYCSMYWEVKNITNLNFTNLEFDIVTRDSSGNISDKENFGHKVTPNGEAVIEELVTNCSSIAKIEFVGLHQYTQIDGEYADRVNKAALSLPIKSASNVPNVSITSSGGPITLDKKVDASESNNSSQNIQYYKLDDLMISMKFQSNPFDVRKKLVGKYVETKMFVEKFVDEGNKARLIGDMSGFTCLMNGDEYGAHNKKGIIVVKGKVAEWSGGIGLDDCQYVSNDGDWKPTDDYESIN